MSSLYERSYRAMVERGAQYAKKMHTGHGNASVAARDRDFLLTCIRLAFEHYEAAMAAHPEDTRGAAAQGWWFLKGALRAHDYDHDAVSPEPEGGSCA